ncbi:MAG: diguanylate cyclase [Holophagaceae bacterium]|nr:diguanylate cyclase [Holophagaceae bacterium]
MSIFRALADKTFFFHGRNFNTRIIVPTVLVLIALVIATNIFYFTRFSHYSRQLIDDKLNANINSLNQYLTECKNNTKAAAVSMAINPSAIRAIANKDIPEISRIFTAAKELYGITYFTITDNKGIVLLRTHGYEKRGDSVAHIQNISDALNGKVSSYFEEAVVAKVTCHTGAPVYSANNKLLGIISAGIRFDTDQAVDDLKKILNSEITILYGDTRVSTTITHDGHRIVDTKLDPIMTKTIIENKHEYHGEAELLGTKYDLFYKPLLNPKNSVFATISLALPETELIFHSKKTLEYGLLLGLFGLLASSMLLYYIISSISAPIIKLSTEMQQVANGNLEIAINADREDEIGLLSKSLRRVIYTVRKLIEGINNMITEHQQGNTNYRMDTGSFNGEYKILADHITELANFSMKDQLTGMLNRRAFNNRIELEWSRSVREKTPLSILIMDIDKFKKYNDTFGHLQGDMALRAVAKVLTNTIKRSLDVVARWGGEEFIVLLPGTDPEGARAVGELIRVRIENLVIPCTDQQAKNVTISIGAYSMVPQKDDTVDKFIIMADAALYQAKEAGRNRVVVS